MHRIYDFHKVSGGKYPNLIRVEARILSVWLAAFAKDKNIKVNTAEDLKPYSVAYYRGRQNVKALLETHLPKDQIVEVTNDEQAFKMLAAGRVDVVISESREGLNIVKSSKNYNGIFELKRLDETRIYAYMNKKHAALAKKIAQTINKMKVAGTFRRLFEEAEKAYNDK